MHAFLSSRGAKAILLTLGVLGGIMAFALFRSSGMPEAVPLDPAQAQVWDKIAPRLQQADNDGAQAGEQRFQRVRDFFAEKKRRTGGFADAVLGWGGKWAFVKGKLFGDEGKGHQEYLRSVFEEHLFTNDDLQNLLQVIIAGYLSDLEGQENALLVAIRADLCDPESPALQSLAALRSDEAFEAAYKKTLADAVPVVSRDLGITVGREAGVWIGSEIAAAITVRIASAVAVRLGISGGILSTGAASGLTTLGIGLAVGFVVDGAVDWIMKQAGYDPAGQIASQTSATLARIEEMLIEGDPEANRLYEKLRRQQSDDPVSWVREECRQAAERLSVGGSLGLRHEFNRLRELRSALREAALKKLILEGGAL
jgi:hypothetical protein